MGATTPLEVERTEVDAVLQSGIFEKAPRLGKFFSYICDRYFEGRADEIKEYSIAVEALGRKPDFDPKKDSIVRVEAHRLRRRLQEYYAGAGAQHAMRIVIPNGQYRPVFLNREDSPAPKPSVPVAATIINTPDLIPPPVTAIEPPAPRAPRRVWPYSVAAVLVIGVVALSLRSWRLHAAVPTPPVQPMPAEAVVPAPPNGTDIRLLAGYRGPIFMDRQGHQWHPDAYFEGGTVKPIPSDRYIEAQRDPHLLKATRFGQFRYNIPLPAGTYELHLLFAETEYGQGNQQAGGEGTRTFRVSVNGVPVLPEEDPLADARGPNRLSERVFKDITPANDGKLHLAFDPLNSTPAMLSGIEILPSARGRIHPVRLITQENPVTDSDGKWWAADEYFTGGTVVLRENVLLHPAECALYRGERYGNFSYRIPLASGKYRLTLYFAEQWFGTPASQMGPLQSRSFDVFANGVALLKGFTTGVEAGGPNRSLKKTFEDISPNAQGYLLLEFVPERNYAAVNAIEVVETQ